MIPHQTGAQGATRYRPFAGATIRITLLFLSLALIAFGFADVSISAHDPWLEMGRLAMGLLAPDFASLQGLGALLLSTLAFALLGVFAGSLSGFCLALFFHLRIVRTFCALIRAVHELFWALIFLQIFGLHPLTGVLAIALPYCGTFARVYAEILEEYDSPARLVLPWGTPRLLVWLYTRLPHAWPHLASYTAYRIECGLRSSAILGFVGLPTLGFTLESVYSEGLYAQAGAILLLFYVLIATVPYWFRRKLVPFYLLAAPCAVDSGLPVVWSNVYRFFTVDIVPAPLRDQSLLNPEVLGEFGAWLSKLVAGQALPGIMNTLILAQVAVVLTGILTLCWFPLLSRWFGGPVRRAIGHWFLVIMRSTPEYLLAYVLLQLWGPSMLPAIVALAVHNGAIIAHLTGRQSSELRLRRDHPGGARLYLYELLPRLYSPMLAFLFYRWEIILRETAILGILGIHTLGFYIDSAIQSIRFDQAALLICITALLNIVVDALARTLRQRMRLRQLTHTIAATEAESMYPETVRRAEH